MKKGKEKRESIKKERLSSWVQMTSPFQEQQQKNSVANFNFLKLDFPIPIWNKWPFEYLLPDPKMPWVRHLNHSKSLHQSQKPFQKH